MFDASQKRPKTLILYWFLQYFEKLDQASWDHFWRALDLKLEAKLTNKLMMWPLVSILAEISKMLKNMLFGGGPRPSNFEAKLTKNRLQTSEKSIKKTSWEV